jgi:uncharacterized protein DUF6931
MSQVRFSTVQDLFEAFPMAAQDVGKVDVGMRSLDFLRSLIDRRDWEHAISFCAYLLPRRTAVAWGCRSLRQMVERFDTNEDRAIGFAEAWVEEPAEATRGKALAIGNINDHNAPATWLALAAGWSGGSVVPPEFDPIEAKPEKTARAVRVALFVALSRLTSDNKDRIMTACLEDGIQFARGGPRSPL